MQRQESVPNKSRQQFISFLSIRYAQNYRSFSKMSDPERTQLDKPEPEESEAKLSDCASDNPSIVRCVRARNRAYNKALAEDESDYKADKEGRLAYLRAMPPLAGHQNIRDFIACVTYAELAEFICHPEAVHYFEAVKVALGTLRDTAKYSDSPKRGPGRPPKASTPEENN
jgi:hypothetical protein